MTLFEVVFGIVTTDSFVVLGLIVFTFVTVFTVLVDVVVLTTGKTEAVALASPFVVGCSFFVVPLGFSVGTGGGFEGVSVVFSSGLGGFKGVSVGFSVGFSLGLSGVFRGVSVGFSVGIGGAGVDDGFSVGTGGASVDAFFSVGTGGAGVDVAFPVGTGGVGVDVVFSVGIGGVGVDVVLPVGTGGVHVVVNSSGAVVVTVSIFLHDFK